MANAIVVLNAGSSSLKFSVFVQAERELELFAHGQMEGIFTHPRFEAFEEDGTEIDSIKWPEPTTPHRAIEFLFEWGASHKMAGHEVVAVGHRVVHGGLDFTAPVLVNPEILASLEQLIPLAPLHQPYNLDAIRSVAAHRPDLPQVACFDTSFHRTNDLTAQEFALPRAYAQAGVKRYGFHGLSYEYIASVLPGFDERAAKGRTVVAHLGNGASMCALKNAKSIAGTMGFSALDGLPMGTRCGALDPGVILFFMDHLGMDARKLEDLLYKKSGLLGVSGISSDMRELLASTEPSAAEAVDLFVYRIIRETGSLAAALGGLDALVFTGGIGEHAAVIRARVCKALGWLGIELDPAANEKDGPRISRGQSRTPAWVIPTNEELMIARHTQALIPRAGRKTAGKV